MVKFRKICDFQDYQAVVLCEYTASLNVRDYCITSVINMHPLENIYLLCMYVYVLGWKVIY